MSYQSVIFTHPSKLYRIVERFDSDYNMVDLKGDSFDAKLIFDPETQGEEQEFEFEEYKEALRLEELAFEKKVERDGVFGYSYEKWNPEPDHGWEVIDSIFGFVGTYEQEKHYIVDEMKENIEAAIVTLCRGYLPKRVWFSPLKQQYAVAFNQTGDVKDLHIWSWHSTKREALLEAKRKTEFRLGFTVNCDDLYTNLDAIEKALK